MRHPLTAAALTALALSASAQRLDRLRDVVPIGPVESPLVAADLDADDDLDLVGAFQGATFGWLNDGTGRFAEGVQVAPSALSSFLHVEDFDGDGLPDVLGRRGSSAALFVQGPAGTFTEDPDAFPFTVSGNVVVLDLEGDGDPDVLRYSFSLLILLRNDGSGTFEDASSLLPSTVGAGSAAVLDAEGDGDDDVVLASSASRLFRNDGEGSFSVEGLPLHLLNSSLLAAVDVEGDGDTDIVLETGNWASNDGSGTFTFRGFLTSTSNGTFLDWDGDGRLDVVRAGIGGRGLLAFRGVEPTQLVQVPVPLFDRFDGQEVESVVAADFDGDGDFDLLVQTGRASMLWGDGNGGWELALGTPERVEERYRGLWTGDVDGDGLQDGLAIAADGSGDERVVWRRGQGGGVFGPPVDVTAVDEWTGAGLIDLENDGFLDALLVSEIEIRAHRFDPSAPWTPAAGSVGAGNATVADVLVGDLTGDGFDDAVVLATRTGGFSTPDYVLWNDGAGELVDSVAGLPIMLFRGDLGDLDGDGDLDFVALSGGETRTYLNRGDGTFDTGAQALVLETSRAAVRVVDLDLSGTLDLALMENRPTPTVRLHSGNGDGTFEPTPRVTLPRDTSFLRPSWLATPDVDADGLPDLYLPDGEVGTFYANRGGFGFHDLSATLPPLGEGAEGFRVAWGDFDADGDEDAWLSGETQVLWSLRRQLSFATWPRLGKELRMELAGSPGGFWGLYASPRAASIPSPLGTFLLDPAQGFALGSGLLDANGDAAMSFAVPAEPSLVNLTLFWQGLVGTPARFTNLETTTFGPF